MEKETNNQENTEWHKQSVNENLKETETEENKWHNRDSF